MRSGARLKGWAASMAAPTPLRGAQDIHHSAPYCLLRLRDRADTYPELDGKGLQFWLDYELEALRYGVDPDLYRKELTALIEGSTVLLPREEHRAGHESDFVW